MKLLVETMQMLRCSVGGWDRSCQESVEAASRAAAQAVRRKRQAVAQAAEVGAHMDWAEVEDHMD